MAKGGRRVWRASPATLTLVTAFCLAAGICVPLLAYLVLVREQSSTVSAFLAVLAVLALLYGWRFGLHPSVSAGADGITVRNPRRTVRFGWPEITVLAPGENGLLIGSEADQVEAWCVQRSRWAARRGRHTRADRIAEELFGLLQSHDPPLEDEETGLRIRRARWNEQGLLTQIERSASKAALSHVFPPEEYPYPTAAIRRRWRRLLRNRMVHVRVLEEFDIPVGLVAFESAGRLRHLAVAPQHARRGYGALLLEYATEEIFDSGAARAELWVLVENKAARAFYRSQGWHDTMERRDNEFPPYPSELQMVRPNPAAPRRSS